MPPTGQVRVFRRSRYIAPLPFPESVEQIITAIQSVFGSDGRRTLGCRFSDPAIWEVKPRGEFPRIRHRAKGLQYLPDHRQGLIERVELIAWEVLLPGVI